MGAATKPQTPEELRKGEQELARQLVEETRKLAQALSKAEGDSGPDEDASEDALATDESAPTDDAGADMAGDTTTDDMPPGDDGDAPPSPEELQQYYASLSPEELQAHFDAIQAAMGSPTDDAGEPTDAPAPLASTEKSEGSLKAQAARDLLQAAQLLSKSQAARPAQARAPQPRAQRQPSPSTPELTKSELEARIRRLCRSHLTKSEDRDAINQFVKNGRRPEDLNRIRHLLA